MRAHVAGTDGLFDESEIERKMQAMFMQNLSVEVGHEHSGLVERRPVPAIKHVVVHEQLGLF